MPNDQERRRSFRVTESALVSYEIIDDETFEAGIAQWRLRSGSPSRARAQLIDLDARLAELVFMAGNESPAVGEVLRLLNDKINIVAHSLPDFLDASQRLAQLKPQPCQLSSEGMLFGVDKELRRNTLIVLQWLVEPDNRFFESFARVIRTDTMNDTEMGSFPYLAAVRFHGVSPAEREFLIQHLFTRQTQELRLRRKAANKADSE